jgi:hypothetical protein
MPRIEIKCIQASEMLLAPHGESLKSDEFSAALSRAWLFASSSRWADWDEKYT